MDYNIREMTIGDYEEALTLTIYDLLLTMGGLSLFYANKMLAIIVRPYYRIISYWLMTGKNNKKRTKS